MVENMHPPIQAIWKDLHLELDKFINSKVNDPELSKDLLQEVFIKVHQKVHTLRSTERLTSWVYQITRNTISDHFRKENKHLKTELPLLLAETPEDEPLYARLANCVNSKIAQLPPKYRDAVLLTSFQDLSQQQLADTLDISLSGAKSRVQRAREQLKEALLNCDNLESTNAGQPIDYSGD